MNLHEYQAKKILLQYGIPVPVFHLAASTQDVEEILKKEGWESAVLKIQIHAGGRGKAGGVKLLHGKDNILAGAQEMLGKQIINEQTGPEGLIVREIILTAPVKIVKEYYLAITIDREKARCVVIASPVGGVEIEKTAKETPDQVLIIPVPFEGKLRAYQLLRLAKFMGWQKTAAQGGKILQKLIKIFEACDASLLEINPLVETQEGELVALDAKMSIDDNALFRHPDLKALFDPTQVTKNEARAQENELSYVALNGDIGCMVNGAGLAMATMDLIKAHGGNPANFLDVGGSATVEKVAEGFSIILSDTNVKAILINIFGGIMNCETLAQGIIQAAKQQKIQVPLVVRMEGTNVEKGKELLSQSGLKIQIASNLSEAAKLAVNHVYTH